MVVLDADVIGHQSKSGIWECVSSMIYIDTARGSMMYIDAARGVWLNWDAAHAAKIAKRAMLRLSSCMYLTHQFPYNSFDSYLGSTLV